MDRDEAGTGQAREWKPEDHDDSEQETGQAFQDYQRREYQSAASRVPSDHSRSDQCERPDALKRSELPAQRDFAQAHQDRRTPKSNTKTQQQD